MSVVRSIDPERREEILEQIKLLARRLRAELGATRVLLFGSFAGGRVHDGSDIDLIVVAPVTGRMHERTGRVRDLTDLPVEPLVFTAEEFARKVQDRASIVAQAVRTGVDL